MMRAAIRAVGSLTIGIIVILILSVPVAAGSVVEGSFVVPLNISNVFSSGMTDSFAAIYWKTNGNASSQVFYDTLVHANTSDYAYASVYNPTLVTSHNVNISGLSPTTTYHYRVKSVTRVSGTDYVAVSPDYTFITTGIPVPPAPMPIPEPTPEPEPEPVPVPEPEPGPAPTPAPVTEPETTPGINEHVIADIDILQAPAAFDTAGNKLNVTGNLITVTTLERRCVIHIPVSLTPGLKLDSFTDAAGIIYEDNILAIPYSSLSSYCKTLLQIVDDSHDLGTDYTIYSGDAVSKGNEVEADVLSVKVKSGYTSRDLTTWDPSLGIVSSAVLLELGTMPENLPAGAKVLLSIITEPDAETSHAFRLLAAEIGMADFSIACVVNVEKTGIENGKDILNATITMIAGNKWVEANGGTGAIRIFRFDPESGVRQVLVTKFTGYDEQERAVFEGISPDGLSSFGLIGIPETSIVEIKNEIFTPTLISTIAVSSLLLVTFVIWFFIFRKRKKKNTES